MGTFQYPNFNNSPLATQNAGVMHGHTQFAFGGRSLDPSQRVGLVPHSGMPVMPAASGRSIQGNAIGPTMPLRNPPVIAFAGNVSHTRMWNYHL